MVEEGFSNDIEAGIPTTYEEETTIWAHNQRKNWVRDGDLKFLDLLEQGKLTEYQVAFFRSVD